MGAGMGAGAERQSEALWGPGRAATSRRVRRGFAEIFRGWRCPESEAVSVTEKVLQTLDALDASTPNKRNAQTD